MGKGTATIARLNLKHIKAAYITAIILALVALIQTSIFYIIASSSGSGMDNATVAPGAYVFLVVLMAAMIIPASNFRKVINLGGRRDNFFWGTLMAYVIIAVLGSMINTVMFYTFDLFIQNSGYFGSLGGVMNPVQVFDWTQNGFAIAFLQQAAFLFLLACFVHTLASVQGKWYGWAANVVIAAILAVFIPIAFLRQSLVWFFEMVIFHENAFIQIAFCIVLAIVIYMLNKPIYTRKAI
ncbi:MAG: hypothetical protein FWE34_05980 [Defluviitaleaceae bacterium]|nr:hypothetical protein [Defluviitaleaceae bacterium]